MTCSINNSYENGSIMWSVHPSTQSFTYFSIIIVEEPIPLQGILTINDENKHMKFKGNMKSASNFPIPTLC